VDIKIDEIERTVSKRMQEIAKLQLASEEKTRVENALRDQLGSPQVFYKVTKGDLVDELLAKYINMTQCPVPIKRLGNGYYLFGTKKIFAKIMNGKLVIRVGGGFMIIEEFIATYAESELQKMRKMQNDDHGSTEGGSHYRGGSAQGKKSPRYGGGTFSPRAGSTGKHSSSGVRSPRGLK
jgi:hypothetical protein